MRSLFTRLLTAQLATVLIALLALGFGLSYMYTQYIFGLKEHDLVQVGQQLANEFASGQVVTPRWWERVRSLVNAAKVYGDAGVWVVSPEGLVVLTSTPDGAEGLRLSEKDVAQIFQGGVVTRRTYLSHVKEPVLAVAVPIANSIAVSGAVLLYSPLPQIMETVNGGRLLILWATILAAGLAVAVSYVSARRIAGPLHEMRSVALEMAGGNFAQRVSVPGRDEVAELATALNDLAARLNTTICALEAEKSKTESVIAGLAEGVLAVDTNRQVLLANEAVQELLKTSALAVGCAIPEGEPAGILGRLHAAFDKVLDTGTSVQFSFDIPSVSLLVSVSPVTAPGGTPLGAVALLHDVSERQRLEKMRRDFVADVSHELRTPLTSIYGFAQAILDGIVTHQDQVHRYLQVIMDESLRLVRLTNTMLDLSRIESQHVKLQLAPVLLPEVVADTQASLEPQLAEKQVMAETALSPNLPPVMADADRLEQIILNLLDNALRHVAEGGKVTVAASVYPENPNMVQVSVTDNGPGIPLDELPYIWERFYKVDKARKQNRKQGTGLGLVIVKQLVELHGGTVWAENVELGGARFVLTLPIAVNDGGEKTA